MDINNFGPFQADVWGTFSDWAMVFVTAYTLRYLRRTLRSQQEVQKDQNALTKIEQARYLREIEPKFALFEPKVDFNDDEGQVTLDFMVFTLGLLQNIAYDIEFTAEPMFTDTGTWHLPREIQHKDKMIQSESIFFFTHYTGKKNPNGHLIYIKFHVTFADSENNKFKQECTFEMIKDKPHVYNSHPEKLDVTRN